jgi:hypothetical protein
MGEIGGRRYRLSLAHTPVLDAMTPLPAQRKQDVPAKYTKLHDGLDDVSGVVIKHSLMYKGLDVPAAASVPELRRLAIAYVEDGKLTDGDVQAMILDGREYSSKRAILFRTDPKALATWEPPEPAAVVAHRHEGRLKISNGPERLCYICRAGSRIRAVFTEQHLIQFVDFDAGQFERVPVQKVIVLEADTATGFVTVLLDAPGKRHPHGRTQTAYFSYWIDRAAAFFQVVLERFPLVTALGQLEKQKRIKIPYTLARTAHGKIALTGIETDDVRDLPEFANLQSKRIAHDQDEYTWLPQPAILPNPVGIPLRDVKTDIDMGSGEIRFMQHALACEVEYVLGQLQTHA